MIPPPDCDLRQPQLIVPSEHCEIHMSGIGGTGVITVNQILAIAAKLDGCNAKVMDQFGGSQKAGPVVSHLKIAREEIVGSAAISPGEADALLIFDLLTATEPKNLRRANAVKTVAIVSTDRVPTGKMIIDPTVSFPEMDSLRNAVDANTRAAENVYFDAQSTAEALLDDYMATNLFVVGAAYQRGVIPIRASCIEEAIRLNGVAVPMNLAAFQWGRIAVARPELVEAALKGEQLAVAGEALLDEKADVSDLVSWASPQLRTIVSPRASDLVSYQDRQYAEAYVRFLRHVVDDAPNELRDGGFVEAVAISLYKLMAYKDEYEVARLHLRSSARDRIRRQFGPNAKVKWNLQPPVLRALGMERKIVVGRWFTPAFVALRSMRHVRGSRADLFGVTSMRRLERELIAEYRDAIDQVLETFLPERADEAIQIAELPDMVRGYESVKETNVLRYRAELGRLLKSVSTPRGDLVAS
jgi:indolepyruvate ferredoxin oxidoreductase